MWKFSGGQPRGKGEVGVVLGRGEGTESSTFDFSVGHAWHVLLIVFLLVMD